MTTFFTMMLFLGAALLACWVVARFPKLAPASLVARGVIAIAAVGLLGQVTVSSGTATQLYVSLFLFLLPVLTLTWLSILWLLQGLQSVMGALR